MKKILSFFAGKGKPIYEILFLATLAVFFFAWSTIRIFKTSDIFPILNGVILLLSIFVFNGKYRIYVLSFYLSSNWCLLPNQIHIGSMSTWCVLVYSMAIFFERLRNNGKLDNKEFRMSAFFAIFCLLMLISFFVNFRTQSIVKFISTISYLSIPLAFYLDKKAEKKVAPLLFLFSLGVFAANLFGMLFIYIFRSLTEKFTSVYMTAQDWTRISSSGLANYRYPGPTGDPNHNGLSILLASSLELIYIFKIKKHWPAHLVLVALLQIGGLLGGSKTYLLVAVAVVLFSSVLFSEKRHRILVVSVISVILLSFLLVSTWTSFGGAIRRLLFFNTRAGLLDALTTGRFSLFVNYMNYLPSDPYHLVFGHGFWAGDKIGGLDFHNFYIQMIYEFGAFGVLFFVLYFSSFISFRAQGNGNPFIIPIFVILFFSLSLHILSDVSVWISLFAISVLERNVSFGRALKDGNGLVPFEIGRLTLDI